MKSTQIYICNRIVELYVQSCGATLDLITATEIEGQRIVLDYKQLDSQYLASLHYSSPGDLVWVDDDLTELPKDADAPSPKTENQSANCLAETVGALVSTRSDDDISDAMLGTWTDDIISLKLLRDNKMVVDGVCDDKNCFRIGDNSLFFCPDWWHISGWRLLAINKERQHGEYRTVLSVTNGELHFWANDKDRIARVFKKTASPAELSDDPAIHRTYMPPLMLVRFESAIANKRLTLQLGLSELEIRKVLSENEIWGNTDPIFQLYQWHNGSHKEYVGRGDAGSLFPCLPERNLRMMSLQSAVAERRKIVDAARRVAGAAGAKPETKGLFQYAKSLIPIFSDGTSLILAIDINPMHHSRVVSFDFWADEPVRVVYESFSDFIDDAIWAIENGINLVPFV